MARRVHRKDEELRRKRAHRASELAYSTQSVGLSDVRAPRPPELARKSTLQREVKARRAWAASQTLGLQVGIGNAAAESAVRQAMPEAGRGDSAFRSRSMGAEVLGRSSDPSWDEDGRVTVRDPQSGLDVTYDPAGGAPDVDLKDVKQGLGGGKPLDRDTREYMEWRFGVSFERVRIHNSSKASAISKALYAHAFALGADVAFASGNYRPGTQDGDRLLAHELTHVVQAGLAPKTGVAAGGEALRKSGSVSEPTDSFEVEADAMADQVVKVGRSDFLKARREGRLSERDDEQRKRARADLGSSSSASAGRSVQRSAMPAQAIARSAPIRREEAAESKAGGDIKFTLKLIDDLEIEIKGAKAKKPTYTQFVTAPGIKRARVTLNLADGKVTGGLLKGTPKMKELDAPIAFTVSADGKIGGTSPGRWSIKGLGEGDIELKAFLGCLGGNAVVGPEHIKAGDDLQVTDFTGSIRVYGASDSVRVKGQGKGSLAGGNLPGDLVLDYDTPTGVTGSLKADIEIPGFKKAFENGQNSGQGGEPLPKFDLTYKGGRWSGDQNVPYDKGAPGMSGQSKVHLKYDDGKFDGGGDGTFEIAEFVSGSVKNSVGADGSVNGKFSIETKTFTVGPVTCEKIWLKGGVTADVVDIQAGGSITAFDGKAKGSFESNLAETGGLVWNGKVSLDVPQMKKTEVDLKYVVGKGFSGQGVVEPKLKALKGSATVKFDGTKLSGDAEFDLDLPLVAGAKVKAKYENGKFQGSTTIEPGAFNLPNIQVTSSSVTAHFGEEFKIDGSASASLAGGQVSGTLNVGYAANKLSADLESNFAVPGLNPVQLNLKYAAGKMSGSAKTPVNLPFGDGGEVEVYYRDDKFGGKGRVGFDIPGLNKVVGELEITPEGQLNGALAIKPKDFAIPPLQIENPDITGTIINGKLGISGGGTVKGIPMTEETTLRVGFSEAHGLTGKIATKLKVPGLKESSGSLELKGGKVSGGIKCAAGMGGFTGGIEVKYNDGNWAGSGTLGYKKGKFDGSVTVAVGETGKLSGKGKVAYQISKNFKVTAELELREDQSMKIGGKIETPERVDLFKKEHKKNLFKMKGRFGIPGLSIQVPVVGVIGLEAQLSGSLDFKAGMDVYLADITASGSMDTGTGEVDLALGGTVKGQAHAGIYASARLAIGLGVGPAFIGGYVQITGGARAEAEISAGVKAAFKSGGPLELDFKAGASAGLVLSLNISGGITASVDLWVKTLKKDWELGSKTWEFRPGGKLETMKDFHHTVGTAPPAASLAPKSMPKIDGNAMAREAGGQTDV